jgi:hypothetical protein
VINGGFVTGEVQWIGGNDGWAKRWQAWWLCSMEEVAERVEMESKGVQNRFQGM